MQRQQEQLDARSWGDGCGPGQSRGGRCGGAPGVCWPRAGPPGLRRQKGWRTGGQTCSQVRRRALCSWLALVCRALGVGPGGPAQCGGGWVSPQDCCLVASGELPHSEGLASLPAGWRTLSPRLSEAQMRVRKWPSTWASWPSAPERAGRAGGLAPTRPGAGRAPGLWLLSGLSSGGGAFLRT